MTQVEPMSDEKDSCDKSLSPPEVVGTNNNNIIHKAGKSLDKTKIPSPLAGHKGKNNSLRTFRLHWNGNSHHHQQQRHCNVQVISMKLELDRLHNWTEFLEKVNSCSSLNFLGVVHQVFTLDGKSLSSLNELNSLTELVVSGQETFQLSPFREAERHKSQVRPASASKIRRFVRANFTKSVIIESNPSDDMEEGNSLIKTFSEQNVSFRTNVSNSLNTTSSNSEARKITPSKPRPVSCFSVRTPNEKGEKKMKNSSQCFTGSKIPKRINRVVDGIMTTSSPPTMAQISSPTPARLTPRNIPSKSDKVISKDRPSRHESLRREFVLPRLVTIIVKGRKPRKYSRFLLNKKSAIAFEQVLNDITVSVKPDWGAIRKVYTLSAHEVATLEDFFQKDKIFLVCPNDKICQDDFELELEECKMLKVPAMLPLKRGKGLEISKSPNRRTKCGIDSSQPSSRMDPKIYTNHPKQLQTSEYPERITQRYFVGDIIGDGNFAVVRECTDKTNGEKYALKVIDKSKCNRDTPPDHEVTILTKVLHPNIILFFDKFNFNNELYVIMELVPGGDLFDAIAEVTKFSEGESACMTRDVASALSFLHSRNIVHRDIKPENLLVSVDNNGQKRIKLGDFGLAQEITGPLYTVCGTPTYVSPEILAETGYGKAVDVWALGVILYVLLCGYPPFVSPTGNQEDLFDLILSGDFEFHPENWDEISDDAKNLISLMLEIDPELRLESDEVLNHPWLAGNSEEGSEKRNMFIRRDDFKFSIFEKMGLTKLPLPNNAYSNSSI